MGIITSKALMPQESRGAVGTAFVALAALCWGVSGGIAGMLMAEGWNALLLSFHRGAIGLLFVLVWLGFRWRDSGLGNRRLWFWSVIAGFGVAGNFGFYFLSIAEGSVAVAATLMYCAPVFVYLLSLALGLESHSAPKWAAMAVVIAGIVLLTEVDDLSASALSPLGVGAGLLAGLSYAIFIFGFKYAAPHGSPQAILAIAFAVLAATLIGFIDPKQTLAALTVEVWPAFAALGVLGAGLSFVLYVRGLRHTAPALASIVAMVEPVTASLFGVWVLGENLQGSQLLGMGLILLAVTGLAVHSSVRPVSHHRISSKVGAVQH